VSLGGTGRTTLILSRHWTGPDSEFSFVTRSLAGAVSRTTAVTVVVPALAGRAAADGAFDLVPAGAGPDGNWADPPAGGWITEVPAGSTVVVDEVDAPTVALLSRLPTASSVHAVAPTGSPGEREGIAPLRFTGSADRDFLGLHVPVNPLAATHRHNGLGFTDYLLVLSDRIGAAAVAPPTAMVAWLTARFPEADLVVVEDASAAVWRGRALRGIVSVDTRTDLWRLLAHARLTVDLAPGPVIGRECIESLRFGTPIVVPAASAAAAHAAAGGGLAFANYAELLEAVERLAGQQARDAMGEVGRRYADSEYGDPAAFVSRVARLVAA